MACTNNIWTKVISVLTIIFCSVFIVAQILIFVFDKKPEDFRQINVYRNEEDPKISILIYCSIVFNALWTITSIVLLIFLRKTEVHEYSIKETQNLLKVYMVWIILGFLSFLPDIISVILHGINYSNSKTGTKKQNDLKDGAYYMLFLSSRFVVFLAFHIFSWLGMIFITRVLQKSLTEDETKPKGRIVPLKPPKPALKPSKVPYLEETNVDRVRDWYKHYEGNENPNVANSNYYSEPNPVPNYFPRLNGNTNPAYVQNSNYGMSRPTSPPPPPPKPTQHHMGANTNVMVNGVTSGTLRRQLPWSYMPNGGELPQRPAPRQPSPQPSNVSAFSGYAPYVPPPDYGSSPKKIQRQELNQTGWNQYL